eukprot:1074648-Amphidinium_carterae.1
MTAVLANLHSAAQTLGDGKSIVQGTLNKQLPKRSFSQPLGSEVKGWHANRLNPSFCNNQAIAQERSRFESERLGDEADIQILMFSESWSQSQVEHSRNMGQCSNAVPFREGVDLYIFPWFPCNIVTCKAC